MAVAKVIFDTSLFVEYVRRKEKRNTMFHKFASNYKPTTTSITVFELWFGARTPKAIETVEGLLWGIPILPFANDAAIIAANEQNRLRKKNQQVDVRDLFIASIAIANNLPFVTLNEKHFNHFSSLKIAEILE